MEKQKLMVVLLIISVALSAISTIGVGYLISKQNTRPAFSRMGGRGNGQFGPQNGMMQQNGQNGNSQNDNTQNQSSATQQ